MSDIDRNVASLIRRELRTFRSSPLNWMVLLGNRLVVSSLLTLLFGISVTYLVATETVTVDTSTSLLYVFQGLVTGNLTLITIVLSVNQLVLSREFNAPDELENRIRHVIDYRDSVRKTTNDVSIPITPTDFLEVLLVGIHDSALELREAGREYDEERLTNDIDTVVSDIITRTDRACSALEGSRMDVFSALAVALEINLSRELRDVREIRSAIDEDDAQELGEKLQNVAEGLKQVDVARQYFKSLYIQSELARFSRLLLYVGIPAVGSGVLLLTTYAGVPDPAFGSVLTVLVPVVITLSFAPLALLFAFILRASIVAQRTVAVTPFTMVPQEKDIVDRE